jgi:hypothetical protein
MTPHASQPMKQAATATRRIQWTVRIAGVRHTTYLEFLSGISDMDPGSGLSCALNERTIRPNGSFPFPRRCYRCFLRRLWRTCDSVRLTVRRPTAFPRHPRRVGRRSSLLRLRVRCSRSGRMRREPLDTPENLPKHAPGQVAFGELQGEVPGMPDEAAAGLEESLLQARQRPALDGPGGGRVGAGDSRGCTR